MKRITLIVSMLFIYLGAFGQINFQEGNISEVMETADGEDLLIFVDVYTTWCGPCKWLSANHFQDEEVGNYFNQNFLTLKVDAEKGDGVDFAKKYNVEAYPTLLFINSKGELVHKMIGAPKDNQALISLGEDALNPETQLLSLSQRYRDSKDDPMTMRNYAKALSTAGEDSAATALATQYFEMTPITDLVDEENWNLFVRTIRDANSDLFLSVIKQKEKLQEAHGDMVDKYQDMVVDQTTYEVSRIRDFEGYEMLKTIIPELYGEFHQKKLAYLNFQYHSLANTATTRMDGSEIEPADPETGHKYAKDYLEQHDPSWVELNEASWGYYLAVENSSYLEDALAWVRSSIALEKNYFNTDTEAHLLYKLERWKEAKDAAKIAIQVGKDAGEDVSPTEDLLDKIKAKK